MRLVRVDPPPEGNSLLVGGDPSPKHGLASARDLTELFAETYDRLHQRLIDHAERFLSRDDARDAVADAVASLWIRWPSLAHEQRSDKYVFGAVHNCVSTMLRKNRRRVSLEDAEPELDGSATHAVYERAQWDSIAEVLDNTLAAMPRKRRQVILLVHEENFSYQDAADALGVKIGTINTHIRLGMDDLRKAFSRAGYRIASPPPLRQLPAPKRGNSND